MVILMYHAFGGPGEPPSRYVVPIRRFSRQLALVKRLRYRVLTLEEYLQCRRDRQKPPARSVVITIDDGYADNRSLAYPVLKRYDYPATIFVVVGKVGYVSDWSRESALVGRKLLSWEDVREMHGRGIHFGAHTRSHPRLTALSAEAARQEIVGSQADLARAIGCPIRLFAYPFGDCDATTLSIASQAGFWASCGTEYGRNTEVTPLHKLRRTEIYGTDNLFRFALKLWSGERDLLGRWSRQLVRGLSAPVSTRTRNRTRALRARFSNWRRYEES